VTSSPLGKGKVKREKEEAVAASNGMSKEEIFCEFHQPRKKQTQHNGEYYRR